MGQGYKGEELRKFVESQQKIERDEQAERRKLEHEHLEVRKREAEAEETKLKLEADKKMKA